MRGQCGDTKSPQTQAKSALGEEGALSFTIDVRRDRWMYTFAGLDVLEYAGSTLHLPGISVIGGRWPIPRRGEKANETSTKGCGCEEAMGHRGLLLPAPMFTG